LFKRAKLNLCEAKQRSAVEGGMMSSAAASWRVKKGAGMITEKNQEGSNKKFGEDQYERSPRLGYLILLSREGAEGQRLNFARWIGNFQQEEINAGG